MTEDTAPTATADAPGQLVGLIVLTVLSAISAVVLAVVALFVGTGTYPTDSELAIKAGLGWWSSFALTVSVVSFIGVLVLAGVRRMLASAGFRV